jgi:16S rRNA (guanine527-N7)-methyltransferase
LDLAPAVLDQLFRFSSLLLHWNRSINLTRICSPTAIASRHIVDSLSVVPHLGPGWTLLDVGSGAGFPGIPVAVARPDLKVTLLEASRKKTAFLRSACRDLGLASCRVVLGRSDDLQLAAMIGEMDAAVSRAAMPPAEWLASGARMVKPGGMVVAMAAGRAPLPPPGLPSPLPRAGNHDKISELHEIRAIEYAIPSGECRHLLVVTRPG